MEENKHFEELDTFAKKYLKEIPTETPSDNFTSSVMDAILADDKKEVYQNTMSLSNSIWFVLGGFIIASISLVMYGESSTIKLPEFDFVKLPALNFNMIHISQTTVYAFFFLALLFGVQIWFMKRISDRRVL